MHRIASIALFIAVAAGCSNPFLSNYRGSRCPEVAAAHVATQPPANATLIGTATFTTDTAVGDVQALGAAQAVGANIVQWDRAFLRDDVVLARNATLAGGMDEVSTSAAEPVAAGDAWYRVHARFWRSNALGSIPEPPAQPPTAEPAAPPPAQPPTAESTP